MLGPQRHKFDIPENIAYFNTAYNAPLLNSSRDRLLAASAAKSHPWERLPSDFFDDAERVRHLASLLFGASPDHYSIIPAASYGISTAARILEPLLKHSDEILLLDEEFPSNVLPWRRVSQQVGCKIRTVKRPSDSDWTAAVLTELRAGVRVVALPAVHWTDGSSLDLVAISYACRSLSAWLILDVTQSLGAVSIDIDRIKPDFMVAAGYKWLLCPYGFGLLYTDEAWHDARPLEESWLARTNAHDFSRLVEYQELYRSGARRFDVGEACVTTVLPGAIAALEQLLEWTIPATTAALCRINGDISNRLQDLGFILPAESLKIQHMFGMRLPPEFTGDLVGLLRSRGVFVSQRGSSIRIAPHLHVTQDDAEVLVAACAEALA